MLKLPDAIPRVPYLLGRDATPAPFEPFLGHGTMGTVCGVLDDPGARKVESASSHCRESHAVSSAFGARVRCNLSFLPSAN